MGGGEGREGEGREGGGGRESERKAFETARLNLIWGEVSGSAQAGRQQAIA